MQKNYFQSGFTFTELLVTLAIFVLISGAIYGTFSLNQKSYREGENLAEITQNGRVTLERITREIRQAEEIVTELSDDESGATSTILFQDGHDITTIHYIHYFKQGTDIKREVIAYYFSGDPSHFVPWDAIPPQGQQKIATTTSESVIIGEYVKSFGLWSSPVVNISLTLEKAGKEINLKTKIFGRNL